MWLIFSGLLALPMIFLVYIEFKVAYRRRLVNKFKGPPTLPIVGNCFQMGQNPSENLHQIIDFWHQYGKDNFRFWLGYYSNIVITNPKYFEFILSSQTLIQKSDIYDLLLPWLGVGLLNSTGSKWHKHRKMITPSFHFNILQDFHEVMNDKSTEFINKLRRVAANENIIDFQEQTSDMTLDIICDTAMGVSINAMYNSNSKIVQAFKDICIYINKRAFNPIKRSDFFYPLYPEYSKYQETLTILRNFTNDIIEKRIEAHKEGTANTKKDENNEFSRKKMAFLDNLLFSTVDGRPLTHAEICAEVNTFVFGGHDTTTAAIGFAVYLLSRHPEEQRKLYEEQCAVMGSDLSREATFQEIAQMKYLELFIKEAQRVYPSVPLMCRITEKDYEICGTVIPKGTSLILASIILGYDERIFKDPHVFRPERFEDERPGPFEYVPFSAGLRNCIGQKFALLEIKTVVSKIIRSFQVLPALDELVSKDNRLSTFLGPVEERLKFEKKRHKYDPILSATLTLKSDNGLHLRLRERI